MAFPALLGQRFAYDRDGTQIRLYNIDSTWVEETTSQAIINAFNTDYGAGNTVDHNTSQKTYTFIFPEARTLRALYKRGYGTTSFAMPTLYSLNTTNGIDGTWTAFGSNTAQTTDVQMSRANLQTFTAIPNVIGVRLVIQVFTTGDRQRVPQQFHMYGDYTGASDRLSFWDPVLDQAVGATHFDFGDVYLNSSSTISFRIKNSSATRTANSITLGTSILQDWPTPFLDDHDVNYNGGAYASSVSIGSLAPGAISNTCTVRRTTPAGALVSPYAVRVNAEPTSWT